MFIGDNIRPIYNRNHSPGPSLLLKNYEGYIDPSIPKVEINQEEKDMNEENMISDSALSYTELENMTLINDGEVKYIKNSKGENITIDNYTKYDYLKDLSYGKFADSIYKCKTLCKSARECRECLRDKMYLPKLQKGDILLAEEDCTAFIYYSDNKVFDTSENSFKTLDEVKNQRIICQVIRVMPVSLAIDSEYDGVEIWSKA
jgi:hypothetical protein